MIGGLKEVCHLIGSCLDEIISSILAAEQLAEVDVSEGAAKKKQTRGTVVTKLIPLVTNYSHLSIVLLYTPISMKVASVMHDA